MSIHAFILQPGGWMGEGKIILNMVEEELNFFTKWKVTSADFAGKIPSIQEIQIAGITEQMRNELTFFDITDKTFSVEMENLNIGRVIGKDIYDEKVIAWEFRENELNFEGFESYHLQKDGSYLVHAEYVTSDQFRTQLQGKIWLPPPGSPDLFNDSDEQEGE
jgi:hypothetical protein